MLNVVGGVTLHYTRPEERTPLMSTSERLAVFLSSFILFGFIHINIIIIVLITFASRSPLRDSDSVTITGWLADGDDDEAQSDSSVVRHTESTVLASSSS